MPPTKAELQQAHERCEQIRRGASALAAAHDYIRAVKQAELALPNQHASVAFQRRFLKLDTPTAPAVALIVRYAPAFFLGQSIRAVQEWYASGKKGERAALPDLPKQLESARIRLGHAVEMWMVLAAEPTAVLRPQANPLTKSILPLWVSAGLIAPRPEDPAAYDRVSDTRRPAVAKCMGCGREQTAPLAALLEPKTCPVCKKRRVFVLTRRATGP